MGFSHISDDVTHMTHGGDQRALPLQETLPIGNESSLWIRHSNTNRQNNIQSIR